MNVSMASGLAALAGEGGLGFGQLVAAQANHGPARPLSIEVGGVGLFDHIKGIGPVLNPQRDADVGVRPDVVVEDAGGPLGAPRGRFVGRGEGLRPRLIDTGGGHQVRAASNPGGAPR